MASKINPRTVERVFSALTAIAAALIGILTNWATATLPGLLERHPWVPWCGVCLLVVISVALGWRSHSRANGGVEATDAPTNEASLTELARTLVALELQSAADMFAVQTPSRQAFLLHLLAADNRPRAGELVHQLTIRHPGRANQLTATLDHELRDLLDTSLHTNTEPRRAPAESSMPANATNVQRMVVEETPPDELDPLRARHDLADVLRAAMEQGALSQQALATRSGVSRSSISRILHSRSVPSQEAVGRLCAALDLENTTRTQLHRLLEMASERPKTKTPGQDASEATVPPAAVSHPGVDEQRAWGSRRFDHTPMVIAAGIAIVLLAVIWLVIKAVGSSSDSTAADGDASCVSPQVPTTVLVYGIHQNQAAPELPAGEPCWLESALVNGGRLAAVSVDGTPAIVWDTTPAAGARTGPAKRDLVALTMSRAASTIRESRPDSPGSDLMQALKIAADLAHDSAGASRIVVFDSGLPDHGILDMTQPGLLAADPADVASALAGELSGLNLAGIEVDLYSFGYTASPQAPLTPAQIKAVVDLWTGLLTRAGAKVNVHPLPRTGKGPGTLFTTKTVLLPKRGALVVCSKEPQVFDDSSVLGFLPDSVQFRDPIAARSLLTPLADWLKANPGRTVTVTGTTASFGSSESRTAVGRARATSVAEVLTSLDVKRSRVAIESALQWPGFVSDKRTDGALDPALAARNRTVRITSTGPGC